MNYRKVTYVLEELGLTYDLKYLDFSEGEHKSDADGMRDSMSSFAAALVAGLISLTVLSSFV